jgi:hypothetical protein
MIIANLVDTIVANTPENIALVSEYKDALQRDFIKALKNNGWNYADVDAINCIVEDCCENKYVLRCLLSRHPNWSNEDQAIIIEVEEPRINNNLYSVDFFNAAFDYIEKEKEDDYQLREQAKLFRSQIFDYHSITVSPILIERLGHVQYTYAHKGEKLSRAINKWAESIQFNKTKLYNKLFANISDSLQIGTIKRTALLSINPVDILLMSNGNSWDSCQSIDVEKSSSSACYRAGSLSYIRDNSSMIFFTPSCTKSPHTSGKINRQMFFFNNGMLVQSRLYPKYEVVHVSDVYRQSVQEIISICLGIDNKWSLSRNHEDVLKAVATLDNAVHYTDYEHSQYLCTRSFLSEHTCSEQVKVGDCAICICCGSEHSDESLLDCCNSQDDEMYHCCDCGCDLGEDDIIQWICGDAYCSDCCFACGGCDEWCSLSHRNTVGDEYICDDCLRHEFIKCAKCGAYIRKTDAVTVCVEHPCFYEEEKYCPDCIETYCETCNKCDAIYDGEACKCSFEVECVENPELVTSC